MPSLEPPLTSVANPRVKGWARLSERKYREKEGRFKLEGIHLVAEALAAGWPLECVVFDEGAGIPDELLPYAEGSAEAVQASGANANGTAGDASFEEAGEGYSSAGRSGPSWIPVSPDIIAKCCETETPQPVFAVALKRPANAESLFASAAGAGPVIALDGVRDPGNVGTIVRGAAAAGARAVVLGKGTADLYNAKTLRSTMGALFHVPILEADLPELLPVARERGATLYGTSLQATASCYDCDLSGGGVWLLFGNEGSGLSPEVEALVDRPIIIPMTGKAESLNVAMAATVLLFEAQRQRMINK